MRKKKTRYPSLVRMTLTLSVVVSVACVAVIAFGPLVFGDLISNSFSSRITEGSNTLSDSSGKSDNQGSPLTTQGSNQGSNTEHQSNSSASGDCILHLVQCADTDANCLETPLFIRALCNDIRCADPQNTCSPVSNSGNGNNNSASTNSGRGESTSSTERSGNSGQGTISPLTSVIQQNQPLGCYDPDGQWTTNRSACAEDQSIFLREQAEGRSESSSSKTDDSSVIPDRPIFGVPSSEPSRPVITPAPVTQEQSRTTIEADRDNPELQRAFQTIFNVQPVDDTDHASELLQTATSALERLQRLRSMPLSPTAAASVNDTQTFVSELLSDLSSQNQSTEDIEAKAMLLRERLADTSKTVAATLPSTSIRPTGVLSTLDHIFATLPTVFAFMQEQGAPIDMNTVTTYQSAGALYLSVQNDCLQTPAKCANLANVIAQLETLRSEIALILQEAGKTDLQGKIDEMLQ